MAFRTDLEAMVLAALIDGPQHGYAVVRTIRGRSEGVLRLGEGQLYPILHRLEEAGLVSGDWEMQEGKPPRKVYSLTEQGHASLAQRRAEWSLFARAVGSVMNEDGATSKAQPRFQAKEAKGNA